MTPEITGLSWFLKMDEAIGSLANLPQRCKLAPESEPFPFEVRELLYGRKPNVYRILFSIEGDVVYVLHIVHRRRLPILQALAKAGAGSFAAPSNDGVKEATATADPYGMTMEKFEVT